jgi:hypothetical protein
MGIMHWKDQSMTFDQSTVHYITYSTNSVPNFPNMNIPSYRPSTQNIRIINLSKLRFLPIQNIIDTTPTPLPSHDDHEVSKDDLTND